MEIVRPARGDYGAIVTFAMRTREDAVFDLSTATTVQGYLSKPDGTVSSKTASKVGDGSTGQMQITIADGDLDQDGEYMLEPEALFSSGQYAGTPYRFTVRPSARS